MKPILLSLLTLLFAGSALAAQTPPVSNAKLENLSPAGGLEAALRQASRGGEPVWVGWTVPMIAGQRRACCFSRDFKPAACLLEGKNQGWGSSDREAPRPDQKLVVLLRYQDGKPGRIHGFSEDCPLDAGGRRFVWLGAVQPEESVAVLARNASEDAISALALHRNANADTALEELASARNPLKQREQALFWMGQTRGERGARFLERVLRDDQDDKVREKAVFSLSQSQASWADETIARTGREDRSPEIRGEALFWLAEMDASQAPDVLLEAIEKDPSPGVREKGVFALSQLPDGKGVRHLVRLGREARDPKVRKEAFFWLAQSDDPEALKYLDKVLNGN
ncbi:MAG TPA: HEAT repeat domain-containing protein [Thermoanaerobaculia bacterium]|nr:HEAT repeat domain-containing protein [Thermoanaerobaculia bacterium]